MCEAVDPGCRVALVRSVCEEHSSQPEADIHELICKLGKVDETVVEIRLQEEARLRSTCEDDHVTQSKKNPQPSEVLETIML